MCHAEPHRKEVRRECHCFLQKRFRVGNQCLELALRNAFVNISGVASGDDVPSFRFGMFWALHGFVVMRSWLRCDTGFVQLLVHRRLKGWGVCACVVHWLHDSLKILSLELYPTITLLMIYVEFFV